MTLRCDVRTGLVLGALIRCAAPAAVHAQTGGDVTGRIREVGGRGVGIAEARVEVAGTGLWATTDYKGRYRLHGVPVGRRQLRVVADGYTGVTIDSVPVSVGTETEQDAFLSLAGSASIGSAPASTLDPSGTGTLRRFSQQDLAGLPLTTLQEGTELWTGVAGESYRAGRSGSQILTIDGIPIRNGYDASTAPVGLRVPIGFIAESWLDPDNPNTSAAAALSGEQGVATADAERQWSARAGYHTDRPASGSADFGFDRVLASAGGPIGQGTLLFALDLAGQLQAFPHNSPPGDPQTPMPWELQHNSGERYDAAAKFAVPLASTHSLEVLGIYSGERQLLFDPVFKYDALAGSAQGIDAALVAAQLRTASHTTVSTLRVSFFSRTATVSELVQPVDPGIGALGGSYQFRGLELARAQDTAAARSALPGFAAPGYSAQTPWGAPAFFLEGGSRGDLFWNQYRELRVDFGLTAAPSRLVTVTGNIGAALGEAQAFQRVLASLPVGDSIPPATASHFRPYTVSAGGLVEGHVFGSQLTGGVRVDAFAPRNDNATQDVDVAASPTVGVLIPLHGLTLSGSLNWSSQFPDLQFLAPIAFDDTLAGGRFRRPGSHLHHEGALAKQVTAAFQLWHRLALRLTAFSTHFTDLIQSATAGAPDSALFSNSGDLRVSGFELHGSERVSAHSIIAGAYAYEAVDFGTANGFRLPTGTAAIHDVLNRFIVTGQTALPFAIETAGIFRFSSGPPFSGVRSGSRSSQLTIDARLRRQFLVAGRGTVLYLDVRNLLNRQNILSYQRSTETPGLTQAAIDSLAQAAYAANPDPIPFESPRYRSSADADHNGSVEGPELLASYQAAAEDFGQPLLAYGAPRTFRFGLEVAF